MSDARYLAAARAELAEGIEFYNGRQPGLGRRFLGEVARSVALICATPGIGRPLGGEMRMAVVHRFPHVPAELPRLSSV